jgi:DNA polymerase
VSCLAPPDLLNCTQCPLYSTRKAVVPGHGDVHARIMLVAEAPGRVEEEHQEPQPLVGPAGRRLDMILERVPLDRSLLYLSNVIKCRPPSNDLRPYPNTIILCPQLWLDGEIQTIKPAVILALGATAGARWFPGYQASEMADMQRVLPDGTCVVGSFHSSYALRRGGEWNSIDESIRQSLLRAKELANA